MTIPLLRRRYAVAVAHETTPGTAESLSSGDLIPNAFDADINPDITVTDRPASGAGVGQLEAWPEAHAGTCRFMVELTTAASPAWATKLLPILGFNSATGGWHPDSRPVGASGSGRETATIGVWRDGTLKRLAGAAATGTFRMAAGGRAMLEIEARGIWLKPSNDTLLNPTILTPARVASGTVTIGTFVPRFAELTIALNNQIALREDVTTASGYQAAEITARRIAGTINAESTLTGTHGAAVWEPYADMVDRVARALSLDVGGYSFDAPVLQVIGASEGERNNAQIDSVEFLLAQNAAAGDDELVIDVPS